MHNMKDWNNIKTRDSWKFLRSWVNLWKDLKPCQELALRSIFGSARTKPKNKYYQIAEK